MTSPGIHKYAKFFPLMEGEEFDGLVEDIKTHGLLEPIVLLGGKILDGRNRFRACKAAGVEPRFTEFNGDQGPLHYVASKNFHRRGLSDTQRAVIWRDLAPELEKEIAARAAERKRSGKTLAAHDAKVEQGKTSKHVASILGTSTATVERVNQVSREAPDLVPRMREGKLTAWEAQQEVRSRRVANMTEKGKKAQVEKRREEEPRQVKSYLDALKAFKRSAGISADTLRAGDASPEAVRFIAKRHEDIRTQMQKIEEVINA